MDVENLHGQIIRVMSVNLNTITSVAKVYTNGEIQEVTMANG